jgi:hemoglobin-like flavoprotein
VSTDYDDLQRSYGRCLRNRDFIARFYEIFLASHPAVPTLFARTDFNKQRLALRRGISIAISYAAGSDIVKRSTAEMADAHGRSGRTPVEPGLYPFWIDSLVKAIAENDDQADAKLLARWREAMGKVTRHFIEHY